MKDKKYGVAEIIDERTIIINAGKNDGIKPEQELKVLSQGTFDITDPFTKEKIGSLNYVKSIIVVSEVMDKYSFCKPKSKHKNIFSDNLFDNKTKFHIDSTQINNQVTNEPIQKGDLIDYKVEF
ncbi:hypothetical protein CPU09_02540 [Mammaliicoccus sciuri]|uniref:hypothetical protein n=1 Tax=Mammaliicoccus sciuri TaxID=1296 RepID=UPI000BBE80B9|nr:hypothetical protein [Mammaliicoccus sciuri]PCM42022.1 hypothetical protein CPU09_02540 [Mammaliicoccus sciuri]